MQIGTYTLSRQEDPPGVQLLTGEGEGGFISDERMPVICHWLRGVPTELPDEGSDASAYGVFVLPGSPCRYEVEDDGIYVHLGRSVQLTPEEAHALADALTRPFAIEAPTRIDDLTSSLLGARGAR